MSINDLNEQEQIRRESLAKLRELGIEPYPAPLYPVNTSTSEIKEGYDPEKANLQDVVIAGRIMSRRIMGAASFGEIQDEKGRIQVYINNKKIIQLSLNNESDCAIIYIQKSVYETGDIYGF